MRRAQRGRSGFTLVEMMLVAGIFGIVGYALMGAVEMGHDSSSQVIGKTRSSSELRGSAGDLSNDLSMANNASVVVNTLPDGNQEVELMQPVGNGPTPAWGVEDPKLGSNPGWKLRFTVAGVQQPGGLDRQLVRQVVDDTGQVRAARILAHGLSGGAGQPPGFTCAWTGSVWVVTVRKRPSQSSHQGEEMSVHVRSRN